MPSFVPTSDFRSEESLPERNSSRRRRGAAEPEVYFRIVHVALQDHGDSTAYREQTVEVAIGPEGAFQNSNIGTLTRRVPASQVVSAVPQRTRRAKRPKTSKEPKTPPVVELLRKAIEWRRQLDAGEVRNQAEIARREGISRARVTQILTLLRLSPQIQKQILALPKTTRRPTITEHALRPITQIVDPKNQWARFRTFLG